MGLDPAHKRAARPSRKQNVASTHDTKKALSLSTPSIGMMANAEHQKSRRTDSPSANSTKTLKQALDIKTQIEFCDTQRRMGRTLPDDYEQTLIELDNLADQSYQRFVALSSRLNLEVDRPSQQEQSNSEDVPTLAAGQVFRQLRIDILTIVRAVNPYRQNRGTPAASMLPVLRSYVRSIFCVVNT